MDLGSRGKKGYKENFQFRIDYGCYLRSTLVRDPRISYSGRFFQQDTESISVPKTQVETAAKFRMKRTAPIPLSIPTIELVEEGKPPRETGRKRSSRQVYQKDNPEDQRQCKSHWCFCNHLLLKHKQLG